MIIELKKDMSLEEMKKKLDEILSRRKKKDLSELCGKVQLTSDPVAYQRMIRDEWE
jgi:predicted HAD superfamily phosphohydrolase